jgi:hypothetical protein
MRIVVLFFACASILLFSSCAARNSRNNKLVKLDNTFLRENGSVNPTIKGYWKSIGNGYIPAFANPCWLVIIVSERRDN